MEFNVSDARQILATLDLPVEADAGLRNFVNFYVSLHCALRDRPIVETGISSSYAKGWNYSAYQAAKPKAAGVQPAPAHPRLDQHRLEKTLWAAGRRVSLDIRVIDDGKQIISQCYAGNLIVDVFDPQPITTVKLVAATGNIDEAPTWGPATMALSSVNGKDPPPGVLKWIAGAGVDPADHTVTFTQLGGTAFQSARSRRR